ncbi:MAG: MATE family efflux transporter [Cytophagaceae bacterium]|nr:MATE family efflux transporter [Cytophagaceae bacterium]
MEDNPSSSKPARPRQNIWKALVEAVRGTEADYTVISLKKAIFLLAVPMVLELVMESTFALADIYFVGKLGASAVATVGLTETYLFLLYSIGMGLAMGVTAIIARRVGEKKKEEASISAVQAVFLAILASIPFAVAGLFYAPELLALMGGDEWTVIYGHPYMQWLMGSNVVIMLLFVINAIFRGAGDAAIAMRILWIANGINIILDPLLIFGIGPFPELGLKGAAIATFIGRGVGVAIQVWTITKGGKHIRIKMSQLYWDARAALNIIKTSLGGVGQMIIGMTSWIFIMRILAGISSEAVAGATIGLRLMMFCMMPAWGMASAAATLVGQNLGANNPDRAEQTIWKVGVYNMIFLLAVSLVFFFFNRELVHFFSEDDEVMDVGAKWLQILSYAMFIYGWWMVASQAFNGAGDTTTPTKINFVFFWLIQIPLAYVFALLLDWSYTGVFWAVFISEVSASLFTLWLFKKGKWKEQKV